MNRIVNNRQFRDRVHMTAQLGGSKRSSRPTWPPSLLLSCDPTHLHGSTCAAPALVFLFTSPTFPFPSQPPTRLSVSPDPSDSPPSAHLLSSSEEKGKQKEESKKSPALPCAPGLIPYFLDFSLLFLLCLDPWPQPLADLSCPFGWDLGGPLICRPYWHTGLEGVAY